jgi:hypothetical protein
MRLVLVLAVVLLLLVTIAGAASEGQDALLLVVDDHFILLDDRPDGPLPTVQPGENGHPADRGALTVLAAQAQDAKEVRVVPFSVSLRPAAAGAAARPAVPFGPPLVLLLYLTSWLHAAELIPGALLCFAVLCVQLQALNSYCSVYGLVSSGWRVSLASWPWLEGKPLIGAAAAGARLQNITINVAAGTASIVEQGQSRAW